MNPSPSLQEQQQTPAFPEATASLPTPPHSLVLEPHSDPSPSFRKSPTLSFRRQRRSEGINTSIIPSATSVLPWRKGPPSASWGAKSPLGGRHHPRLSFPFLMAGWQSGRQAGRPPSPLRSAANTPFPLPQIPHYQAQPTSLPSRSAANHPSNPPSPGAAPAPSLPPPHQQV